MTEFIPRDCFTEEGTPKVRHNTRSAALNYRKRFSHPKNLRAYHCDYCGYWHLGHLQQVVRKRSLPVA
jgi:hypothetical protein